MVGPACRADSALSGSWGLLARKYSEDQTSTESHTTFGTLHGLQSTPTSPTGASTGPEKKAIGPWRYLIAVLCLYVVPFCVGLAAGWHRSYRIAAIAAICGYAVWLLALVSLFVWWE